MKKNSAHIQHPVWPNAGFTMLEVIIYMALLSLVVLLVSSFTVYFTNANNQTKGDRETSENARRALEIMSYEIRGATGVYTPTTTANQLSLETSRYAPDGETTNYIDFFLCGQRLCLKKEGQDPVFLTSDTVNITNLVFTRLVTGGLESVKIDVTATSVYGGHQPPSAIVNTTASLRNY